MTLQQAVNLAAQHDASMDLTLDTDEDGPAVGFYRVTVHTPGPGGFMMIDNSGDPERVVQWTDVADWTLHLTAGGTRA